MLAIGNSAASGDARDESRCADKRTTRQAAKIGAIDPKATSARH
jgi:hypothetical protein